MISDVRGQYEKLSVVAFVELIQMIGANDLSSRGAKDVLAVLLSKGGESARTIAAETGLLQVSDTESLRTAVQAVLSSNPDVVEEYRAGKESVLQFLVGQGMKATKGAGNPTLIRDLLLEEIGQ